MTIGPSHPYNAGTENVGFSLSRQTLLAPSTKRREVSGESSDWRAATCYEPQTFGEGRGGGGYVPLDKLASQGPCSRARQEKSKADKAVTLLPACTGFLRES